MKTVRTARKIALTIRDTAGNVAGEVRADGSVIPGRGGPETPVRILTLRPKLKRAD